MFLPKHVVRITVVIVKRCFYLFYVVFVIFKMNPTEDSQANNNLRELRADVAATTSVLKVTVDKLVQRGENLDALNDRAENLNSTSYHFLGTSRRVHRHMKWQNCKLTICLS